MATLAPASRTLRERDWRTVARSGLAGALWVGCSERSRMSVLCNGVSGSDAASASLAPASASPSATGPAATLRFVDDRRQTPLDGLDQCQSRQRFLSVTHDQRPANFDTKVRATPASGPGRAALCQPARQRLWWRRWDSEGSARSGLARALWMGCSERSRMSVLRNGPSATSNPPTLESAATLERDPTPPTFPSHRPRSPAILL